VQLFFDTPTTGGTAIDDAGNLYVTDVNKKRLLKITLQAQGTTLVQDERLICPMPCGLTTTGTSGFPAPNSTAGPACTAARMR
jgi:hypothetical protein